MRLSDGVTSSHPVTITCLTISDFSHCREDAIRLQAVIFVVEQAGEVLFFERGELAGKGERALAEFGVVRVFGEADEGMEGLFYFALREEGFQILIWHRRRLYCESTVGALIGTKKERQGLSLFLFFNLPNKFGGYRAMCLNALTVRSLFKDFKYWSTVSPSPLTYF